MKNHEDHDGWINLKYINEFKKMKKFNLSLPHVYEMMKKSTVVNVKEQKWDDDMLYYIRKIDVEIKPEFGQIFGFNMETIKMLTKDQFEIFMEHK